MPPTKPVIYDLATDYARFGLTEWEANVLLAKKIPGRRGSRAEKIILHIQDGRTVGSLRHWLGVSASSSYMVQRDGSILAIIPEDDGPWTNGDVNAPIYADFPNVPAGFWNDPNVFSITIEAEGTPSEPLTPAQLDAIEWLCRDIMRRRPNITVADVNRHRSINSVTRWRCPGQSDHNDYFLAMQKRLAGGTTKQYAMPIVYDWLDRDELAKGLDRKIGSTTAYALRREWEVERDTPRLRAAKMTDALTGRVGPHLRAGDTFIGEHVMFNKAGGWVLTEFGTRVFMGDLVVPAYLKNELPEAA